MGGPEKGRIMTALKMTGFGLAALALTQGARAAEAPLLPLAAALPVCSEEAVKQVAPAGAAITRTPLHIGYSYGYVRSSTARPAGVTTETGDHVDVVFHPDRTSVTVRSLDDGDYKKYGQASTRIHLNVVTDWSSLSRETKPEGKITNAHQAAANTMAHATDIINSLANCLVEKSQLKPGLPSRQRPAGHIFLTTSPAFR